MDDQTLVYMESRVKKGEALRDIIIGLERGLEKLKAEETQYINLSFGSSSYSMNLSDWVPRDVICSLLKDDIVASLEKAIPQVKDEYAKL